MATSNTDTPINNIQSLFNGQGNQDAIKMMARMNERMAAIFVEAGTRSIEIMSNTAKEALSNLGDATHVRKDPAEYANAYGELAQKQIELMTRAAQDIGEVSQKAGTETQELASKAGEEMSDKAVANAKEATDKMIAAAKDAADNSTAHAKDAADKAGSPAKKTA